MKKLSLFFITCLLSTTWIWADVSVVENYSSAPGGGATLTEREYTGCNFVWKYNYGRTKTTDVVKVSSSETQRAIWLTNHTDVDAGQVGYLNTTLEGGLKAVAFKFIQGAIADAGDHLYISIDVNGVEADKKDGGVAVSSNAEVQSYSKNDFEVKENDIAFAIKCTSTSTRTNPEHIGRVLVANVTITPYLLYTLKETSVGLQQRGFKNTDLIDNTGGTGTISYSSNAEGVATIDANGVITPVSVGDAVITANWDNKVSTTYTLHVVDGIINENFSQVVQTGSSGTTGSEWLGSVCKWDTKFARRGANDIVRNGKQCSWLSLDGTTRGYLRTKELEGGIKTVSFNYAQFGAEKGKVLKWKVSTIGTETISDEIERDGDEGENRTQSTGIAYTHTFNCAENAQLEILNTSVLDNGTQPTNNARILIGDIKITPWLLYTTKKAIIDLNQTGFVNNDLINNTGTNASYESSATSVADIDEYGVITPHSAGETTITASWGSVSTTYKLYVEETITEDYSKAPTSGVSTDRATFDGNFSTWAYRNARSKTTDKLNSGIRGFWLSPEASANNTYLESTTEGGIKKVNFNWRQFDKAQNDYLFVMSIKTNSSVELDQVTFTGADSYVDVDQSYSKELAIKRTDSKLTIQNLSTQSDGTTKGGKIIVGPITITPYLLYTDKYKKFMRIGGTYTNTSLINNTGCESGTLSYRSSNDEIATVDSSTGEVTGVAEGTVTITAKFAWDGSADYVETTYQVEVLPANCETFSSSETTSNYAANEESASGDKATWKARLAGIKTGDFEPYVAFIRAPRQGEDKEAYLESSAIEDGIASMTFDWNLVAGEANTTWDIRILINGREVKRLGDDDLAEASKDKMENFAQITIPAINEPGNFIIRFENHSTVNGTYTSGNKARFVIDNICWTNYSGTKTLAENVNNEGWIRNNIGPQNVAISRSELKGGMWNTLCLPFALPVSSLGVVENGVQQLNSASLDGDELTIGFTPYTGDNLVAGTPYLVQPSSDVDISDTYNDVTITSIASPVVVGGGLVTLQGIFSPKELTAGDKNSLFVGTPDENGDNLFYPEVTGNLLGFRAYFKISEGGASSAPAIRRARFIVNEAQSPTALDEADNALQSSRKVLENGHLFIIRDGKKYNVTGQKIQ